MLMMVLGDLDRMLIVCRTILMIVMLVVTTTMVMIPQEVKTIGREDQVARRVESSHLREQYVCYRIREQPYCFLQSMQQSIFTRRIPRC